MSKKKFEGGLPSSFSAGVAQMVDTSAEDRKERPTASAEEQATRMEQGRTQGKKGCKAIRINMAFTPSNHDFIRVLATATGKTLTEVTNNIVAQFAKEHPEIKAKAQAVLDEAGGIF